MRRLENDCHVRLFDSVHVAGHVIRRARCSAVLRLTLGAFALASAACDGGVFSPGSTDRLEKGAPAPATPDIVVDTDTALSAIANQAYATSPDFTRISVVYPSAKDPVAIEEWVSTSALAAYAPIQPGTAMGPGTALPEGSIVVRAVVSSPDAGGDGSVQALTLMVKGPPGTDPDVGDWWYAVTDPDGNPLAADDGSLQVGPLTADCHSCHRARGSSNDFLFGVPLADRPGVDWPSVLASVANQAYTASPAFARASTIYPSKKDPVDIGEWVSASAADTYAQIDPTSDAGPPDVTMPEGAVIVRAVYPLPDAGDPNVVQALTLMVKGPPGSDPDVGDWAFAVTDPKGNPASLPDGGLEEGPLVDECHSCHRDQRGAENDYLFGVPAAVRP